MAETSNESRFQFNAELDPRFGRALEAWRNRKGLYKRDMAQAALFLFATLPAEDRDRALEAVVAWLESGAGELPGVIPGESPQPRQ